MPYRILMLTNSLDIGGAETHIVELSRALCKKGHTVFVCSSGGIYESELSACGITHFTLPLKSKKHLAFCAAEIARIVKKYRIDIVHSHARIPSLAAYLACRKTPLTVTAHYNFEVSPLLSLLTKWGDSQLAVSEDLRSYLHTDYNINEENVIVTVNGIDTEKFCESAESEAVCRELGIADNDFVLLCVCRMDEGACKSVFDTLDIAPELDKIILRMKIVIVGAGNALGEVYSRALQINEQCKKELVIATGARSDIAPLCARADAFVGVSRAALEAMACGTPVILAGNQGFAGLYDNAPKDICRATNFTLRGFGKSTPQEIYNELSRLYAMDIAKRRCLCALQRKLVEEEYSTEIMADDAVRAYKNAEKSKYFDFLICGYYGFDNMGDDSMLAAIVESLRAHIDAPSIAVLSKDGIVPRGVDGVVAVDRFNLLSVLSAIKKSRVVMFGGGNLIQDATSSRSLKYYLTLLKAAISLGKKTMLYANGVGPVSPKNAKAVSAVLKKVDIISVREQDSYNYLISLGVDAGRLFLTADEVFAVSDTPPSPISEENYAVISLRGWSSLDEEFAVKLANVLNRLYSERKIKSVFACLQDSVDLPVCAALAPLVEGSVLLDGLDRGQFSALVKDSRFVLGMRLHSLVYACREGVPCIGISYDKKIDSFLSYVGNPYLLQASKLDEGLLEKYIGKVLEGKDDFAELSAKMKALAEENCHLAKALLERKK